MRRSTWVVGLVAAGAGTFLYGTMPLCGCSTKLGSYSSSMRSDLRNLEPAQEAYFADHGRYTTDVAELGYAPSDGVTVTILHADADGWAARSTHRGFAEGAYEQADCVVAGGDRAPEVMTTMKHRSPSPDRVVVCDLDGWSPAQSRLDRWRWRFGD